MRSFSPESDNLIFRGPSGAPRLHHLCSSEPARKTERFRTVYRKIAPAVDCENQQLSNFRRHDDDPVDSDRRGPVAFFLCTPTNRCTAPAIISQFIFASGGGPPLGGRAPTQKKYTGRPRASYKGIDSASFRPHIATHHLVGGGVDMVAKNPSWRDFRGAASRKDVNTFVNSVVSYPSQTRARASTELESFCTSRVEPAQEGRSGSTTGF